MKDILNLLREKKSYLEKFLEESRNEKINFQSNQFENLGSLYKKREEILLNIESIYKRINKKYLETSSDMLDKHQKRQIEKILNQIKENVHFIMEEDLELISCIESEKTKIIREISQTKEGRRVLKKYNGL